MIGNSRETLSLSLRIRVFAVVCLVAILTWAGRHFLIDDALIYFRYMRNAFSGPGLVYNPGEYVNALTSATYTDLLLLFTWITAGHVHLAAGLLFFLTFAGACAVAEREFPFSGLFAASMSFFYTLIGMETSLLLLLTVVAVALLRAERYNWLPTVLVLLLMTRVEAGALLPVAAFWMYRRRRYPSPAAFLPALVILAGMLALNHHLYGSFISASSSGKLAQGRSGYWGRWPTAFFHVRVLWTESKGAPYTIPVLALAGLAGVYLLRRTAWNALVLPFLGIMLLFYILCNIPSYHWYYAPFLFLAATYASVPFSGSKPLQAVLLVLVLAQALTATHFLHSPEARNGNYRQIGEWLDRNATTGQSVAACEIGELGWTTQRKVIDILGLTEPKNADHIAHHDVTSWLAEDKPDFIVIHRPVWSWESAAAASLDYEAVPFHAGDVYLLHRKP